MKTLGDLLSTEAREDYFFNMNTPATKSNVEAFDIAMKLMSVVHSDVLFNNVEDGGTCNLDSVYIKLKGRRKSFIKLIQDITGLELYHHPYYRGAYIIAYDYAGQADRRASHVKFIYDELTSRGLDVNVYYQID
ncbi:hypothetical protein [Riemerella columbipharyngis]|uniref:Uncharacterized protein n=1 Tax=Riemerella columbipharyngis TaxID=1071918 RepID=A0A1G7AMR1_9FLAO|nr:hypothetical protein [Riemerella columbipharyngis]SDE16053.1 hypothetical protein SAMN05421544_10435 [Riemerella columbipharyngis]